MATQIKPAPAQTTDTFPINGTDHLEFYVGNAKQSSVYYRAAFGFTLVGYRGPETGTRDRVSYVLQQGQVRLVLTTPLRPSGPIAAHIAAHGDGVHDIALWVDDARLAYKLAVERGARSAQEANGPPRRPGRGGARQRSTPTATPSTPWSSGATIRARSCPASPP